MAQRRGLPDGGPRGPSRAGWSRRPPTDFDLRNPLAIQPKRASVETTYGDPRRDAASGSSSQNVAFEGFMVRREVVDAIGLPDPSFFIFYDDVDFALRARRAGFRIWAVRDAVLVRQLDFDQQHDLDGWKGFYMYRNLFVVHFRYGENALVRLKPYADRRRRGRCSARCAAGGPRRRNVIRAIALAPGACATLPGFGRPASPSLDSPAPPTVRSPPVSVSVVQPRPRRRRLRLLRPDHRRALRQRARPRRCSCSSAATTSAATPTARPTRRPASRCTSTARTSSTPPTSGCGSTSTGSPTFTELPAPGLRPVPGPGLLAADEPRR